MTNIDDIISTARDSMTARRVFGDPYEKDGVTLIPAAAVRGGGGGGEGDDGSSTGGGGFSKSITLGMMVAEIPVLRLS